ncbi:tyrosine-protein phosphatase [Chitinophagaceae bacterium LWZ2-11]
MKKIIASLMVVMPFVVTAQVADSTQRVLHVQGAINFRDLGGYKTTDGKQVRWDKVFRSAEISHLSDQDLQLLAEKHINAVVDFRGDDEVSKAKDRLPANTDYIQLPAGSEQTGNMMQAMQGLTSGDSLMIAFYSRTDHLSAKYKPFFQKLLQLPDTSALMFHCTAGKDRTGIGAAFFLYALGVPEATIMNDYLASNVYRKDVNEKMVGMMVQMKINEQTAKDMASVKSAYLQATFNAINNQYGSMDNFLQKELGIGNNEKKILRAKYTM